MKVECLVKLVRQYNRMDNLVESEASAYKAIAVAKKLPQTKSLSRIYYILGSVYHGRAKYIKAIEAYTNSMAVAEKSNDKAWVAGMYMALSALYVNIPDYNKALEACQNAVQLYNAIGDTSEIYGVYMNIGTIYNNLQKPVTALGYIQKALRHFEQYDEDGNYGIFEASRGIAESYLIATDEDLIKMGVKGPQKYDLILSHLFKALHIAEKMEDFVTEVGNVNKKIGTVYEKMGNSTLALQHYQTAFEEIKKLVKLRENKDDLSGILYQLGNFYLNKGDIVNSKTYLNESLKVSSKTELFARQRDALEKLSIVYEKTKHYDSAYFFYKQYTAVKDSIFNTEKEKEITRKQLQIDFAVKENEFRLTQQLADGKLKQQELQLSAEKKIKWLLIAGILLSLVFAGFIFYNQRKAKKLNITINEQRASLEQLGHVKDKLFSVVSHDMRAPVNSLISFIDILDNGNIAPDKLNLYAKDLKENLSYTSTLMNNLLNWAASQLQGFKPVKENFDVAVKVDETVNTLQHQLQQKKLTLQNDISAGTIINADSNMTAAILRNLISNAIKYSYKEGTIKISATCSADGCTIMVKDEGAGMDAVQTAAFNSNQLNQTESTRGTANEKGTGLGLLLCKTFATQMGGKITAVKDDTGMTMKVWLPA